jgi:AAA ATPase containing von Willebrand factor type A (vWA) domain
MKYLNLLKKYDRELDKVYSRLLKESKDLDSPGAEEVVDAEDDGGEEEVEGESLGGEKETAVEFDDLEESETGDAEDEPEDGQDREHPETGEEEVEEGKSGGKADEILAKIKTLTDDPDFEIHIEDSETGDDGTLKIRGHYERDFDLDDLWKEEEPTTAEEIKREVNHEISETLKKLGVDKECEYEVVLPTDQEITDSYNSDYGVEFELNCKCGNGLNEEDGEKPSSDLDTNMSKKELSKGKEFFARTDEEEGGEEKDGGEFKDTRLKSWEEFSGETQDGETPVDEDDMTKGSVHNGGERDLLDGGTHNGHEKIDEGDDTFARFFDGIGGGEDVGAEDEESSEGDIGDGTVAEDDEEELDGTGFFDDEDTAEDKNPEKKEEPEDKPEDTEPEEKPKAEEPAKEEKPEETEPKDETPPEEDDGNKEKAETKPENEGGDEEGGKKKDEPEKEEEDDEEKTLKESIRAVTKFVKANRKYFK